MCIFHFSSHMPVHFKANVFRPDYMQQLECLALLPFLGMRGGMQKRCECSNGPLSGSVVNARKVYVDNFTCDHVDK